MKALLVTSRVTFVPNNYDDLIVGLAGCPQIGGLLVLDNADCRLLLQSLGTVALGARRVGLALLRNRFGTSMRRRRRAYAAAGKPVLHGNTVNCAAFVGQVRDGGYDLVVNARTRYIYGREALAAPRLGCINVHHGLLPEQRGTMCDLWALHERSPAGFTIHGMKARVDAGEILARVEVSDGSDRDYLGYLVRAARREVRAVTETLEHIERADRIEGEPNVAPPGLVHRRNPTWRQIRELRRGGLAV